jgi:hypothetical protein
MRHLLAWAAYQARDDRGVVHSRRTRYFQDQTVVLGLLGRALVGIAGPDSELHKRPKNEQTWEPRQSVHG